MTTLRPCTGCHRHVRAGDPCPFCGRAPTAFGPTLAALAIIGALASGCGGGAATADTTTTPSNDSSPPSEQQTDDRAAADPQPGVDNEPEERGPDGGGAVAAYGAPAPPPGPSPGPE